MNRQDAIRLKKARYFNGKPCKYGHVAERYANNSACVECHSKVAAISKRKQYAENPEKERQRAKEWRKANPSKANFLRAKRIADTLQRTPKWLTKMDLFEIQCIYAYRTALKAIGLDYHVDHIIPLRGKIVSGLHVPTNLQILHAKANSSKSNSFSISDSWMGN